MKIKRKIPDSDKIFETLRRKPNFKLAIFNIRKLFKIPSGGFTTNDQYAEWLNKNFRQEGTLKEKNKLNQIVKNKGIYLGVPKKINPKEIDGRFWWWDFNFSVIRICKNEGLPPSWVDTVMRIILHSKFSPPRFNLESGYEYDSEKDTLVVTVKIYNQIDQEEYEQFWHIIKGAVRSLPKPNFKHISDWEHQIYKWRNMGKDNSWISRQKGYMTLTPNNIAQIYRRLSKLLD